MGLDVAIYGEDDQPLASKRIGNVAHVAHLKGIATRSLGSESLVVSKVLYDGTHAGDSLSVADLEPLSRELQVLERASDSDMQAFAHDMLEMVRAALQYENPIHFT